MTNVSNAQAQLVFQSDPNAMKIMQDTWEKVHGVCKNYLNHNTRIQTIHGQVYEGMIVHVDRHHVFLKVQTNPNGSRQFNYTPYPSPYYPYPPFNPYANTILPLVLYELLVISLLA